MIRLLLVLLLFTTSHADNERRGLYPDIGIKILTSSSIGRGGSSTSSSSSQTIIHAVSPNEERRRKISMKALIINIMADIGPHGMPLAYAFAQGGPTGIVPAIALVVVFGLTSAYTMMALAYLAVETNATGIGEVWAALIGVNSKWVVDVVLTALCFGCCLLYSSFIGDISKALTSVAKPYGFISSRNGMLITITTALLLPLCLLENLSAPQVTRIFGVTGMFYTAFFHIKRLFDKSYAPGQLLFDNLPEIRRPSWELTSSQSFGNKMTNLFHVNMGVFVLINVLCVSFMGHYNAIEHYEKLKDASPQRYKTAILAAYGTIFIIFTTMMMTGYCIFGQSVQPLILNNFHFIEDRLATIARIATGGAICFAYPLMFSGLKSAMFELLDLNSRSESIKDGVSIATLTIITFTACKCSEENVSTVLEIVGSLLGCAAAYILPAILRLAHMKRQRQRRGLYPRQNQIEVLLNHVILIFGVGVSAVGMYMTLAKKGGLLRGLISSTQESANMEAV